MRLYRHVARFPVSDPAGRVLPVQEPDLTGDLGRRLNVFDTGSLRRILGYRWSDHVSNERLLRESRMRLYVSQLCNTV